jgi:predicted dehydrogenase
VDFDTGVAGLVEINTTTTRPLPRWHVDGTAGSADGPHSPDFRLETWAEVDFTPAAGGKAERLPPAGHGLDEVGIWERFAGAVRGERAAAVDPRTVLCTMALLDAARRSAREGCAVDVGNVVDWVY